MNRIKTYFSHQRFLMAFVLLLALPLSVLADVRLKASAPSTVPVEEPFQIQFEVNSDKVSSFKAPSMAGLEVIYGPAKSQMSSYQIINGRSSQSFSITYSYTVIAHKVGTISIPAASAVADGHTVNSNTLRIKVVQGGGQSQPQRGGGGRQVQPSSNTAGHAISGRDLFMTATANKTRVYEQEAILVTYKVYSLVNLTQLDGKMPDLKGFHCQEVNLPQQKSFTTETHNGRTYRSLVWKQYVIFPQQTGKMEIPAITFEGLVAQENPSLDPIDAFFNTGSSYVEVKKKLVTPKITIDVDPLPSKPSNFSGGVGSYSLSSLSAPSTGRTGEAMTFKLTVKGNGNMKLIKAPTIAFSKDFDVYDPKQKDNTKLTSGGVSGTVDYEYVVVPRHTGDYTIPAAEFCFFDINSKSYRTLRTQPVKVHIEKGSGRSAAFHGKEDVGQLDTDIRFIRMGDVSLSERGTLFFASALYWCLYVLALLLFVVVLVVLRRHIAERSDVLLMKGKRANKTALKRLRKASEYLGHNESDKFYDEVMRASLGYVADRFRIPNEQLSKDNIEQTLHDCGCDESTVTSFLHVLNECELARFAAQQNRAVAMSKLFDSAVSVITKLENNKKK